jgi:hypothetical protein
MLRLLTILLALVAPCALAQRAATELPPHALKASIGEDIVVNGVAMRATHFQSPASTQDVLEFYRKSWASAIPAEQPREQSLGTWRVVGRQNGSQHETVQIRELPGGGTEGYIASSDTRSRPRAPARSPIRLPLGASTISVVESKEGTRQATQILARSPLNIALTERWLRTAARMQGFESEHASDEPARSDGSKALFLKRGGEELISVVQPAGKGSVIVIHHVTAAARSGR